MTEQELRALEAKCLIDALEIGDMRAARAIVLASVLSGMWQKQPTSKPA